MVGKKEIIASIIIPVYNVESYLIECLDSIFVHQQISCPIEVIVINDGSTDGSLDILNEYKKQHDFILFTQDNLGIGCARNIGIDAAKGKYLLFMDSDDYLVPDSLDSLLQYLSDSGDDIVEFDYKISNESKFRISYKGRIPSVEYGTGQDVFPVWEKSGFYRSMIWKCAVSREMVLSNKLYFYPGILHEDEEWSPKIYAFAAAVRHLQLDIYVHRIRENSIMTVKRTLENYIGWLKSVDSLREFSSSREFSPKYIKAVRRKFVSIYFWALRDIKFDGNYNEQLISELEKRKDVIKFSEDFHRRIIYKYIIDVLGIKNFHKLKFGFKKFFSFKPAQIK